MNLKRSLIALAMTGGTAATLFGGSVVHTALTSDSPLNFTTGGATVAGAATTGASTDVSNLQPGQVRGVNIALDNTKSTADVAAYITFNGFDATHGSPNLNQFVFEDEVNGRPTYVNIPLNGTPVQVATIKAGQQVVQALVIGLKQNADNSWNGATGVVHYTVHYQDISGTDANHFVPTHDPAA